MASGYEKSPDYGGPDPTWRFWLFVIAVTAMTVWSVVGAFAAEYRGTADHITDGDTLWVCDRGACTKIRLCGIDAPDRLRPAWTFTALPIKGGMATAGTRRGIG